MNTTGAHRTARAGLWTLVSVVVAFATACASQRTVFISANDAYVVDTASGDEGPGARTFFVVERIDGRPVDNSIGTSRAASFGQGARLRTLSVGRPIPSGPVRLTLRGSHEYGMPAAQIFMAAISRSQSVVGEVDVTLEPGVSYRVSGILDGEFRREVWLEERASGRIVAKVVKPLSETEQANLAAADRYTCCNLHYASSWISDGNWVEEPFLAPGRRVKITGWGRDRAKLSIEGRPIEVGLDYSSKQQTREQFADRILVREDPRPRIASWPPEVQAAIAAGKITKGMTREQVFVSLGVPRPDRNPDANALKLIYFASESAEFDVDFDADDRVQGVQATTRVRKLVWMTP